MVAVLRVMSQAFLVWWIGDRSRVGFAMSAWSTVVGTLCVQGMAHLGFYSYKDADFAGVSRMRAGFASGRDDGSGGGGAGGHAHETVVLPPTHAGGRTTQRETCVRVGPGLQR